MADQPNTAGYTQDEIEESHRVLRQVLPLLTKHHIPATPSHFSLWYAYVAGTPLGLRNEMDTLIAASKLTPAAMDGLRHKYLEGPSPDHIKRFSEEMKRMVSEVQGEMLRIGGEAETTGEKLGQGERVLQSATDTQAIRNAVSQLINTSRNLREQSETSQHRLSQQSQQLETLQKEYVQIQNEARTDFLTGAANRKAFDLKLREYVEGPAGMGRSICLLLIDVDYFKRFNDSYGHQAGDEVLKMVTQRAATQLQSPALLARIGGEEFAVILPGKIFDQALLVAEQIRNAIATTKLRAKGGTQDLGKVTVSIGVVERREEETPQVLMERVDVAMYQAKQEGRNRVCGDRSAK